MRIKRLLLVTGAVSLAVILVLVAVYTATAQEGARGRENRGIATSVLRSLQSLSILTTEYAAYHEEGPGQQVLQEQASLAKILSGANFHGDEENTILARLVAQDTQFSSDFEQLLLIYDRESPGSAAQPAEMAERLRSSIRLDIELMASDAIRLSDIFGARVAATQTAAAVILGAALLMLIALGIILFLVAWKRMLVPLMQLQKGTQLIAGGKLDYRLDIGSHDEIGELAANFNTMAGRIEESYHSIEKARDELEMKVRERTAELLRTSEELHRSNTELQQFAYVASHDLQEPLRTISSFLQLIEKRYADSINDEAREFIGFSVAAANRLQEMIKALLEYSRIQLRGSPFIKVETAAVVNEAVNNLHIAIEESGAKITTVGLPLIYADRSQLIRLFQNLILNALKFHGVQTPDINITAEKKDREWYFCVKDNGIGIDPKYKERIFQIFQRLHGRGVPGIGVGLAICMRIVERHGGRIWVESETGKGAAFWFTIPLRGGD